MEVRKLFKVLVMGGIALGTTTVGCGSEQSNCNTQQTEDGGTQLCGGGGGVRGW